MSKIIWGLVTMFLSIWIGSFLMALLGKTWMASPVWLSTWMGVAIGLVTTFTGLYKVFRGSRSHNPTN